MQILANNIKELRLFYRKELSAIYGAEEAHNVTDYVVEHVLNVSRTQLIIQADRVISELQKKILKDILIRLLNHEPVQYILGYAYFIGLKLAVDKNVLIPRPETEELVYWMLDDPAMKSSSVNILDIGTGSGCVAISLKRKRSTTRVHAIDISAKAIDIAKKNAATYNLNIDFIKADILDRALLQNYSLTPLPFHYIVSNPPYVLQSEKLHMRKNVIDFEPYTALFVNDDDPLVFYKAIAEFSFKYLAQEDGKLFLEINEAKADDVKKVLTEAGFTKLEIKKDMQGKDRMIRAMR